MKTPIICKKNYVKKSNIKWKIGTNSNSFYNFLTIETWNIFRWFVDTFSTILSMFKLWYISESFKNDIFHKMAIWAHSGAPLSRCNSLHKESNVGYVEKEIRWPKEYPFNSIGWTLLKHDDIHNHVLKYTPSPDNETPDKEKNL